MRFIHTVFVITVFWLTISCNNNLEHNPDHVLWADSVAEHARNLMDKHEPGTSLIYLDSIYRVTKNRGVADIWRKYNVKVHYYSYYAPDTSMRRIYVDSMFLLLKEREDKYAFEYANSYLAMADLLKTEKKYDQAFQYYYTGLSFARENLDNCSMSEFSNALGLIRYSQGEFMKAVPYLKEALNEILECANPSMQYGFIQPQGILNTIALCFEKSGRPDSAIYYYNKALIFISERKAMYPQNIVFADVARGVVEGNLGGAYAQINDFENAEKHLKENIKTNDRPGYAIEDAQTGKIKLAGLYVNRNRLVEADALLGQLETDLITGRGRSLANDDVRSKWYNLKSIYYDKMGDLSRAYYYIRKYHAFMDSLNTVNKGLIHSDVDQIFKQQEQKYQLSMLKKNNEIKTVYLATLIFFLIMALGVSLIIWNYLRLSKKSIKELTEVNRRKKLALNALEQSQKDNTRMMKIVAHDLRNPIGAMSSMAELMLEEGLRTEEDRMSLGLIKTAGESALTLVSNLLQVNQTTSEALVKQPVDLNDLIHYCADLLRHQAVAKGQQIVLHTSPIIVSLNYEKMWRVISNLISNAIKFSPQGKSITITTVYNNHRVRIEVKDQGIGIPSEIRSRIFDIFTEAKRPGTAGEESFGLGLAISRQIVEAHRGTIWFESNEDSGTTFVIDLPEC